MADRVRWGIIGTASIAARAFLPAVTEAGGVAVVAGRDAGRAAQWARENGIDRVIVGYQQLVDDPNVDAVYIPLPNSLHAEWTIKALRAGKPVLCEKPLTASPAEAEQVLAVAAQTGTPLWEAFVFPFHDQMTRIRGLLADGIIGELREIQSNFHFALGSAAARTRMSASLAGGALYDVGCYPVRLARDLFGGEHDTARAGAVWDPAGVDVETWGWLGFPGDRRLLLSCGFRRALDTFSRLVGTAGQINISNPFHPAAQDSFQVCVPGRDPVSYPGAGQDRYSFTPAVRHIQAVVAGREPPRWLATATSLGSARALADLAASARQPV
jgi:predicted dehydrogenase